MKTGDPSTWDGHPAEPSEPTSRFNKILVSSILLEQQKNGLGHLDSMSLRLRIPGKEMDVKNDRWLGLLKVTRKPLGGGGTHL